MGFEVAPNLQLRSREWELSKHVRGIVGIAEGACSHPKVDGDQTCPAHVPDVQDAHMRNILTHIHVYLLP